MILLFDNYFRLFYEQIINYYIITIKLAVVLAQVIVEFSHLSLDIFLALP